MSDEHVAVHGDDDRLPRSTDLIVRQACEHGRYDRHYWGDFSESQFPEHTEECPGGREIVLRRSRGYSEMVEWEGEVWLEVEK